MSGIVKSIILSGPSGSGKTAMARRLLKDYGNIFGFVVSHTTRFPRPMEREGVDYYYVNREAIWKGIAAGNFLEHTEFLGNIYGTSKTSVNTASINNHVCVMDLNINGVRKLKTTYLMPYSIYIRPTSIKMVETKLRRRNTEADDEIHRRVMLAKTDMDEAEEAGLFDTIIIEDDVNLAYSRLVQILQERIRMYFNTN
ncbi:guanylate kinase [Volepox virus]|uniref:guanylate kinase n=1 Tax=Volepox virus TaxID=28874 RepID=A0A1C9KCK9_9POXV|nr:guanylate kinase [Volepox virus]AOP31868.1 guanylate kinase [Volepox virus]